MYLVVGLNVLIGIVYLYALTQTQSLTFLTDAQSMRSFADILLGIVFSAMLAEFLRHFQQRQSFWGATIRKAILCLEQLALRSVFDVLNPIGLYEANVAGLGAAVTSQADIDLKVIAMIVFLFSLSAVIRYGNALKQDSDSIL